MQLERPVSGAGSGFLSQHGEGLSGASGFGLSKPAQTAVHTFSPHPLRLISVLSAMTYLRLNPSHLRQSGGLSKHCLPAPLSKLPGPWAHLEREGLAGRACDQEN